MTREDTDYPPGLLHSPLMPGTSRDKTACPIFPGLCRLSRVLCTLETRKNVRQGCPVRTVPGDATPSAAASVAACYCTAELSQA